MKLSECTIGRLVQEHGGEIGHVVGLVYNVHVKLTGNMSQQELRQRTIPLVRFPYGERAVHHANLEPFKD